MKRIIGLVVATILVAGCSSTAGSDDSAAGVADTKAKSGVALTVSDDQGTPITLTLTGSVDPSQVADPATDRVPAHSERIVAVKFTIRNTGSKKTVSDFGGDIAAQLDDGSDVEVLRTTSTSCDSFGSSGPVTIDAGQTISGCQTFDVPNDHQIATVSFTPRKGSSDNIATWTLRRSETKVTPPRP